MHVLRNLSFDLFLILCLRKEDSKTVEDSGPTPKKVGNFFKAIQKLHCINEQEVYPPNVVAVRTLASHIYVQRKNLYQ